jgi:apolipoprotein N-acyltransferase
VAHKMASFRSIEQGFNLIRQTAGGLSAAYDYQGRRLAAMDHYQTAEYVMVSEVPMRGVRTIYARLGDWFAWVYLVRYLIFQAEVIERRFGAVVLPHHDQQASDNENHTEHEQDHFLLTCFC